ncbi:MAG: argininosuccinate lyase, partial [Oscillospiraceae bacterium]|nr:argininosuccinate lyase [Oscillospiraceae bacterium]
MRKAAAQGFINATDCADYLVKKGMPFRDAYTIVGRLVNHCISAGQTLESLPLEEYKKLSDTFDADVYQAIDLNTCVETRLVEGGPSESPYWRS